jgi:hypothetical protein
MIYKPSPVQQEFHALKVDEALFGGAAGPGKAAALDTLVLTDKGVCFIENLAVGDKVFDEKLELCNVVDKSQVWEGRPCYRMTFNRGEPIVVDGEHEWLINNGRGRSDLITTGKLFKFTVGQQIPREKWEVFIQKGNELIKLENIEGGESVPTQCIQVDSPSHLFLIGSAGIPTHNSLTLLMDPLDQIAVEHERCRRGEIRWGHSTGKAIHFRREYPRLEETIDRSKRIYPDIDPKAKYDETDHTWVFSSGYKLKFAHLKDSDSFHNYRSSQFTWLGFDELREFERDQYLEDVAYALG